MALVRQCKVKPPSHERRGRAGRPRPGRGPGAGPRSPLALRHRRRLRRRPDAGGSPGCRGTGCAPPPSCASGHPAGRRAVAGFIRDRRHRPGLAAARDQADHGGRAPPPVERQPAATGARAPAALGAHRGRRRPGPQRRPGPGLETVTARKPPGFSPPPARQATDSRSGRSPDRSRPPAARDPPAREQDMMIPEEEGPWPTTSLPLSPEFLATFGEDGTDVFETAAPSSGGLRFERMFILTVLAGPQMGLAHEIAGPELVLGRGEGCALVLNDPGLSRRHCRIIKQGEQLFIEDLDSSNGTFVDGDLVPGPPGAGRGGAHPPGPTHRAQPDPAGSPGAPRRPPAVRIVDARSADRAVQPALLRSAPARGVRLRQPPPAAPVGHPARPRPLQAGQRQLRPPRRATRS